jgi:hypothetical protein
LSKKHSLWLKWFLLHVFTSFWSQLCNKLCHLWPTRSILPSLVLLMIKHNCILRPTLDWGLGSKFLRTNLDAFQPNWIFELDFTFDLNLPHRSSNHELSFLDFFGGFEPIDFPFKMVPSKFLLHQKHLHLGFSHYVIERPLKFTFFIHGDNMFSCHYKLKLQNSLLRVQIR